jgi:hypothetical protein
LPRPAGACADAGGISNVKAESVKTTVKTSAGALRKHFINETLLLTLSAGFFDRLRTAARNKPKVRAEIMTDVLARSTRVMRMRFSGGTSKADGGQTGLCDAKCRTRRAINACDQLFTP